ncbi:hypothetical protein D5018_04490 [Parashewanella curva]|uniref:Uncharacterized protein n=1 Tax=Parashewanella curva TaxID=2338552 RepID=A0A3L8PZU6_9GAMM|nr:hypothetical protein [Parashewanella curva]RLV60904.1 hypothetical protein D5018_04490 [Parashewanella curva]
MSISTTSPSRQQLAEMSYYGYEQEMDGHVLDLSDKRFTVRDCPTDKDMQQQDDYFTEMAEGALFHPP